MLLLAACDSAPEDMPATSIGYSDNHEHLCPGDAAMPVRVHAAVGVVLDPGRNPNVETTIDISR
jgi:hypothetical protein